MTESEHNPYAFAGEMESAEVASAVRPKWLTFIGVTALVLGLVGLLVALGGVAGQVFGRSVQQQIVTAAKQQPKNAQLQVQAEIQSAAMRINDKYFVPNIVTMATSLVACLLLVVGSVLLLKRSPAACRVMLAACLATIVTDLGKSVVGGFAQRDNMRMMGDVMPGAIAADPNMPPETSEKIQQMMGPMMTIMGIVVFVLTIIWFLLKAAFYAFSISYLAKPAVRGYFQRSDSGAAVP